MLNARRLLIALVFLVLLASRHAESRTWTDNTGKFTIEGELIDFSSDTVTLRKPSGKTIPPVSFRRLSKADQDHIKSFVFGKVTGVVDGDTIAFRDDEYTVHKIRLQGIDAPERHQDFGTKSKEALSSKIFGKRVRIKTKEKDRYGRTERKSHYDHACLES